MKVDARYQSVLGSDAKTSNEYSFLSDKLVKQNEVLFSDNVGDITLTAGCIQSYDVSDRLISAEYNNGYKEFYSYETSSTGLDSLYHIIGGKDDYYLSTYDEWPAAPYASDGFYSYPLYVSLYTPEGSIDGYMHKGGAILEKRSTPNNVVFSFQNTFDSSNRITETKIMNKGALFGTYKITY